MVMETEIITVSNGTVGGRNFRTARRASYVLAAKRDNGRRQRREAMANSYLRVL